ncbi:hypothetical protein FE257_000962 [Aspergillus nanangensis]|uniref:Nephrocystin 3-like N-terminal domain-containing protein n=1 Tax=Aspergillus nanangensis TaxID=2582783 RepID=A0AAD4CEE9_ASPNN|nr:hypothetical protein FE257_000962 [Aspergillus nanangensis]
MRSRDEYTVGWVCALPLEMTAAMAILDTSHPALTYPPTDTNAYSLGSIAGHNVVITCLPSGIYGTISAATVVSQMVSTFPQLQFGLMVGIGGGVPSRTHDIRLGDVVVSKPTGSCSGVVQYDYGKAMQGGRFEQTGALNHPPQLLLTHIAQLQAEKLGKSDGGGLYPALLGVLRDNPRLEEEFGYPGLDGDVLFQADYAHAPGNDTCANCKLDFAVSRESRRTRDPQIHYGIIASGDQVMKDSEARDRLARDLGILLSTFAPRTLRQLTKPREMNAAEKGCFNRLFQSDPEEDKNALKRRKGERAPNTCNWLLDTPEIHRWLFKSQDIIPFTEQRESLDSNILWLYGNPGMGKSMMAIMMAEELPKLPSIEGKASVAYFFCESSSGVRRTSLAVLRGLLHQLIKARPELVRFLFAKYEQRKEAMFTSFDTLWSVLTSIGADADSGEKFCIIDALDECDMESQETLLTQISQTFNSRNADGPSTLHFLITSRPYPEISRCLSQFPRQDLLDYTEVKSDLRKFIKSKVADLEAKNHYSKKVSEEIAAIVEEKAEGTFLWVGIACSELANVRSRDAGRTLRRLPRGLHSLYQNLLDTALTHDGDQNQLVVQIVSLVAIAEEPLSVQELSIACDLYPDEDTESRFNFTKEDIEMCRLMVIVQDGLVRLLHKSVRDFLLRGEATRAGLVDTLHAHATLAYRCLDVYLLSFDTFSLLTGFGDYQEVSDLEQMLLERSKGQSVLLRYGDKHWFRHARSARHEFRVLTRHERFFRNEAQERNAWVSHLPGAGEWPLDKFSSFHLAAFCGLSSVIDFALVEMQQNDAPEKLDPNQTVSFDDGLFTDARMPTPLHMAAQAGHTEIVSLLLKKGVRDMSIGKPVFVAAAANEEHGGAEIMSLLLQHTACDQDSLVDTLMAAARNRGSGPSVMALLLDKHRDIELTEDLLLCAADNFACGGHIMRLLLDHADKEVNISQTVCRGAITNRGNGVAIMTVLLDHPKAKPSLDQLDVPYICRLLDASIIYLLSKDMDIRLTEDVVDGAVSNADCRNQVLVALLDRCQDWEISAQRIFDKIWMPFGSSNAIDLLLKHHGHDITLTEEVVSSTTITSDGTARIKELPHRCQKPISDSAATAIFQRFHGDVIETMLQTNKHIQITENILGAVTRNQNHHFGAIRALLQAQRTELTGPLMRIICECFDMDIVRPLLHRHTTFRITHEMVFGAAVSGKRDLILEFINHAGGYDMATELEIMLYQWFDCEVVEALIQHSGLPEATDTLIRAIVANRMHGSGIMAMLMKRNIPIDQSLLPVICSNLDTHVADMIPDLWITEETLSAALYNPLYGRDIALLLLKKYGNSGEMSPRAFSLICRHFAWDGEIFSLLRNSKDAEGYVNKGMLMASRQSQDDGNRYHRAYSNYLVEIQSPGGRPWNLFPVTDAMLDEAAADEVYGSKVMTGLLGTVECVHIPEEIVRTAVSNRLEGKDLVELLLSRYPDQMFLTEGVLLSAIANDQCGRSIISHLLCHHTGTQLQVTPKMIWVAAAASAEDILIMLFRSTDIRVQVNQAVFEAVCQLFGSEMLSLLLREYGACVRVIAKCIEAAADAAPDIAAESSPAISAFWGYIQVNLQSKLIEMWEGVIPYLIRPDADNITWDQMLSTTTWCHKYNLTELKLRAAATTILHEMTHFYDLFGEEKAEDVQYSRRAQDGSIVMKLAVNKEAIGLAVVEPENTIKNADNLALFALGS